MKLKLVNTVITLLVISLGLTGVFAEIIIRAAIKPERQICTVDPREFISEPELLTFSSKADETTLKGWFLRAQEARGTLILAHGYRQNRLPNIPQAVTLINSVLKAGYNCLLFDFRACGESEGTISTFGLLESEDLLAAIEEVKTNLAPHQDIYLLGISMGAVTCILAAAKTDQVAGLILDSPFSDLHAYFQQNLQVWTGLPAQPFNILLISVGSRVTGIDINQVSPVEVAKRIQIPVLLIHSQRDQIVPVAESLKLYLALKGGRKELWLVEKGGHGMSFFEYPDQYLRKVLEFLRKAKK